MALKKTYEIEGVAQIHSELGIIEGGTVSVSRETYIRVKSVAGDKLVITAGVLISGDGVQVEKSYTFPADMEGPNYVAQAYLHLKTLDEFADAEDC